MRIKTIVKQSRQNSKLKPVYDAFDPNKPIIVTVNVEVYNHEKYLKQCLDSILNQLVDFNVVINIHDDASTDCSAKIIKEYEEKYPNIVCPIYQKENIYSKVQKEYAVLTIQGLRVKGTYVAMCEGDDYWTDPYKLKIQVESMNSNPDAHLCLHIVEKINDYNKELICLMPDYKMKSVLKSKYFIPLILRKYSFQTSSYFFKVDDSITYYSNLPKFAEIMPTGDETMIMYYGSLGKVIFVNKKMSVYRKFAEGSWSIRHRQYDHEKNKSVSLMRIDSLKEYDKFTNGKYHKYCMNRIYRVQIPIAIKENTLSEYLKDKSFKRFFIRHHFMTYLFYKHPKIREVLRRNG